MSIAQLEQHFNAKARTHPYHFDRLIRNGCWIILAVTVPISIWMAFAALCLVILEITANLDKVLQQQAQVIFAA